MRDARDLDLGRCVVRCCHCGIRFLTDPRNAERRNLRCPFGCREQHRKQSANHRSARYYRTAEGRRKKKLRNAQRSLRRHFSAGASPSSDDDLASRDDLASHDELAHEVSSDGQRATPCHAGLRHGSANIEALPETPWEVELPLEGVVLDEASVAHSPMLPYVAMVASLIEGRSVSERELVDALLKTMRQRSMARWTRSRYVLHFLNQHPP